MRLNRLQFACGCVKATDRVGRRNGRLLGVVRPLSRGLCALRWNGLWYGLAAVVVTAGIGKIVGLWSANNKFGYGDR